jgi:hypothetical protein
MPTSYEIYQTYLRGPAAVIRLFEQTRGENVKFAYLTNEYNPQELTGRHDRGPVLRKTIKAVPPLGSINYRVCHFFSPL